MEYPLGQRIQGQRNGLGSLLEPYRERPTSSIATRRTAEVNVVLRED